MREDLEFKVIDTEKKVKLKKRKLVVAIINAAYALVVFLFFTENSITEYSAAEELFGINNSINFYMLLSVLFISIILLFVVYIPVPGKGKIILNKEDVFLRYGKNVRNYKVLSFTQINFYYNNKQDYWLEYNIDNKKTIISIDIVFAKEKENLKELIKVWQQNGANAFIGPMIRNS